MPFTLKKRLPFFFSLAVFSVSVVCSCAAGYYGNLERISFSRDNAKIVIDKVHNLGGKIVRMGVNDTLVFKGGILENGSIVGNNTYVEASDTHIFLGVTLSGLWDSNSVACPEWFGAKGDGVKDDASSIQLALDHFRKVKLGKKKYATGKRIQVYSNTEFFGEGDRSILFNIVNTGYDKTIVNIGDISSGKMTGSPIMRDRIEVNSLKGNKVVLKVREKTLQPGHVLLLTDGEDDGHAFRHQDIAIVTGVSGKDVTLDWAFTNQRLLNSNKLYLVDLALRQDIKGNNIGQIEHNVYVHDMMLSHKYPNTGSGMYAIGIAGYNVHIERVNMNTVTPPPMAQICLRGL